MQVGTGNGDPELPSVQGYKGPPCLRGYKSEDLVLQVWGWACGWQTHPGRKLNVKKLEAMPGGRNADGGA
jgi:hypothetical protein